MRCPFCGATMLEPILFKTLVYWLFVFIARLLEALVEFLMHSHSLGEFLPHLASTFSWHRFAAIQIWILVLFLIYVTASELNQLFWSWRVQAHFSHLPAIRTAAKPASTNTRARPSEPTCRRRFPRRVT